MRPLRVEMRAFGPYATCQVLDFADLAGRRFFLIHGPTGSGKTTILDAMVFALYGVTSGSERDAADMRSDHADPRSLTEVTFDFALGADNYRVWRRPAQERPKLRGEGSTTELQDATLWKLGAASPEGEGPAIQGRPLATGWSKVSAACEGLLGFRAEQFRQVVMLPQGRFQELLRADSPGRADILATLFGTQHFALLERELKEAAAAQRKKLQSLADEQRWLLASIGVESADLLAAASAQAAERLAEASERRVRLDDARTEAEAALNRARDEQARLDAATEAEASLAALQDRLPELDSRRAESTAGRQAALVAEADRHLSRCREARDVLAGELAAAEQARATAESVRTQALVERQAQEAEADALEEARRRVAELGELREKAGPLAEAGARVETTAAALHAATAAVDDSRKALAAACAAHDGVRLDRALSRAAAAQEVACASAAQAARATSRQRRDLDVLDEKLAAAEDDATRAAAEAREADDRWQAAGGRLAALEAAWAAGQAAVLARTLQPGTPCPVCGATDHPAPASAGAETPEEDELAVARATVSPALRERDAARARESETRAAVRGLHSSRAVLRGSLGDAVDLTQADCDTAAETAEKAAGDAREAAHALPALEARVEETRGAVRRAEEAAAAARECLDATSTEHARARGAYGERAAAVPEALREPAALEAATAAAEALAADLQRARDAAEAAVHSADLRLADARAAETAAARALAAADDASSAAADAFARSLVLHGFADAEGSPDADAWCAALCDDARLAELEATITTFERELAEARGRAAQAASAAAGLVAPDVAGLQRVTREARAAAEEAVSVAAASQAEVEKLEAAANRVTELRTAAAEGGRRFSVVGRLAQLTNGDNPARLTLQRFVLGVFLDTVLVAATARLSLLSKGRYSLVRTDERRGGKRSAGLDLDVYDAWTGVERPVSTLSGGESFMAALCLALALAETVQAYSGGVYLDTVFIDEGFGTLDDEALDLAVATLMDLQEGDRLVGIISHVGELRDRVDARLEITAERGTSRARFVVP